MGGVFVLLKTKMSYKTPPPSIDPPVYVQAVVKEDLGQSYQVELWQENSSKNITKAAPETLPFFSDIPKIDCQNDGVKTKFEGTEKPSTSSFASISSNFLIKQG